MCSWTTADVIKCSLSQSPPFARQMSNGRQYNRIARIKLQFDLAVSELWAESMTLNMNWPWTSSSSFKVSFISGNKYCSSELRWFSKSLFRSYQVHYSSASRAQLPHQNVQNFKLNQYVQNLPPHSLFCLGKRYGEKSGLLNAVR